jgi:Proline dehydrogenase.
VSGLRLLFREAAKLDAAITVDMEQYAFKDLTLEIFRGVWRKKNFPPRRGQRLHCKRISEKRRAMFAR